jgi:hypothetical protein
MTMDHEPRFAGDYGDRQVEAAHRALIDVHQVLGSFGVPAYLNPALEILREKFATIDSYGPQQVVEFHQAVSEEERELQARTAYELVSRFLKGMDS